MQIRQNLLLSCITISALVSCASGPPSYETNVRSAHSGLGSVDVTFLSESVVLLTGKVEDIYTLNAIERAAWKNDKIEKVINRIYVLY